MPELSIFDIAGPVMVGPSSSHTAGACKIGQFARALYHNPKVLILDEATSALDNQTEQAVMEAVNKLSKDITIIMIAHRFNTVKNCDVIFQFEKGELIKQGSFDEVINDNKSYFFQNNE